MKRFRYAHQLALDVACERERVAARRLAAARDAHLHSLAARTAIDCDERALRTALVAQSCDRSGVAIRGGSVELVTYERCLAVFATRRRAVDSVVAGAEGDLADARELAAMRRNERDALDRHRRRAAEAHALACDRIEANELDDAAGLAHEARVRAARKDAA